MSELFPEQEQVAIGINIPEVPVEQQAPVEQENKYFGKVKAYLNKKQYGFITRLPDGKEFFVHRMSIKLQKDSKCFPKLFPGEYVEFTIHGPEEPDPETKKHGQVGSVTGLYGNTLRCEDIQKQKEYRFKNTH